MKKIVVLLACSLLASSFVFAQTSLKIGWIESSELVNAMPEKALADTAIARYARDFQSQLDVMMKQYQTEGQDYQSNQKTMSDAMKEVKQDELQDLQSRIQTTQQSAQDKLQQKKQDLYQPIFDKASKAIQEVAKEKGYDYIFDKSGGILLVGRESDNILPLVKAKLGIK